MPVSFIMIIWIYLLWEFSGRKFMNDEGMLVKNNLYQKIAVDKRGCFRGTMLDANFS